MGKFLKGFVVGLVLLPVLAAIYILGGFAPAAVTDKPFPFERYIAGAALEAKIHRYAPKRDLSTFSAADITAGAQTYRRGCGGCHGLPGETEAFPGPKMFPPPPKLFTPDGYVTDDPVGVTYWKIKNGIRMTAMPSFDGLLKDDQMWQVAALLASADKLPPDVLDILKQPLFPPPPPPANGASNVPDAAPGRQAGAKH
ncbi:MAG TPA: cytochrome c [Candidatus Acidoferrum sp.]|nr:cytochrome c [Candidatus Acidoferrum sp.]